MVQAFLDLLQVLEDPGEALALHVGPMLARLHDSVHNDLHDGDHGPEKAHGQEGHPHGRGVALEDFVQVSLSCGGCVALELAYGEVAIRRHLHNILTRITAFVPRKEPYG